MVYPGVRSSMRLERLREGIADYEKMRILAAKAVEGLKRLDQVLTQFTFTAVLKTPAADAVREGQKLLVELTKGQ